MARRFLRLAGDYQNWIVYKKSLIICDVTEMFIKRELPYNSRTVDQMRQAARSCKQNIVEGVTDGSTSKETCIKLMGIAKGSLRELLEDYRDYLRQHKMEIWDLSDSRTEATRAFSRKCDKPEVYVEKCEQRSGEAVANIMITMICQLDAILGQVMMEVEEAFLKDGGLREQMTATRIEARKGRGY